MIQNCTICGQRYETPYRGWYDQYVPWACSSRCFARMIKESTYECLNPADCDSRVTRHFTPFGHDLRSGYEREFRQWLQNRKGMEWQYEPYTFTLKSKKRYVPDFWLENRVFIEVKGLWSSEAKKKFKAMLDEFYGLPIVVVDRAFLDMLKRTDKVIRPMKGAVRGKSR